MSAQITPEPEDALAIAWADFYRAARPSHRQDAAERVNAARAAIAKATGAAL